MAVVGFRELAAIWRDEINSGKLAPGVALPSEKRLSETHGVSRTTVRRALALLEEERIVEVRPGLGRHVRAPSQSTAIRNLDEQAEYAAKELRKVYDAGRESSMSVGTVADIAVRYHVSTEAVQAAFQKLHGEGLVQAIQGRGWYWRAGSGDLTKTHQVAAKLRDSIASGKWQPGTLIPSESLLSQEFGVGRVTIRRAIRQLSDEGILATRPGVGTSVVEGSA